MSNTYPKISIVTPSYNQAQFLEEALVSVYTQNYPDLEYVVIDGGSTDGSVDIIRNYEDRLAYWVSGPDGGHYEAINQGFAKTGGDIMAWLNSDDKYTPWALRVVGYIFATFPEIEWLTTLYPLTWDDQGQAIRCTYHQGYSRQGFFKGEHLPQTGRHTKWAVQQESTFWRRELWERAGGYLDTSFRLAADFELWARFYQHTDLYGIETPLGGFRVHNAQKTAGSYDQYVEEAKAVLARYGGRPSGRLESLIRCKLFGYLPWSLRRPLVRLGLLYPHKVCIYLGLQQGWKVLTV